LETRSTFVDLFAGTGAFTHSLEKSGLYECVFANDFAKASKDIYTLNNKSPFVLSDVHDINVKDIPPHDMLCAGFPCTPFSRIGMKRGFDDARSRVFWKIIEILEYHQPEHFILENVKYLKSHDSGQTFQKITNALENCGYFLKYAVLDTSKCTGVPQRRERIYIVGFRDEEACERFTFDVPAQTLGNVWDYLETDVPDSYYYPHDDDFIQSQVTKRNVIYQRRRKNEVRENKSSVCPTLTTSPSSVPIIRDDKGVRRCTPRECFNLQGFPRDYKLPKLLDRELYTLAGNAISVPVIDLICTRLKKNSSLTTGYENCKSTKHGD